MVTAIVGSIWELIFEEGTELKDKPDFYVCDGRSLKVVDYPELFSVVGYTYGGDGEAFNLPSFKVNKAVRSYPGEMSLEGMLCAMVIKVR